MNPELHAAIAAYFDASNRNAPEALLRAFAPDALVIDEKIERRGHAAIRQWQQEVSDQYHPTATPHTVVASGGETMVTATVSGDFPGSPVDLRFVFRLEDGRIARLEITLA